MTALMWAVSENSVNVLKSLLQAGASVDTQTEVINIYLLGVLQR
jgi:ankyrin repeat protein